MTTAILLRSLVSLFQSSFEEYRLFFAAKKDSSDVVLPHVFIGSLPPEYKDDDWPHVMFELPKGIKDDEELATIPLTIHIGVTADTDNEGIDAPTYEILRLLDMVRMILLQNRIVGESYRLKLPVSSGIDRTRGALKYAIGAVSVEYETGSPAPIILEGTENGYK
ncbi:hypothetical protein [Geovibrio ferrireducens]|uniref:hypothetical protein n=1 Tax=Geovibrio ferrireducens TaxID=46201 RepID=UPI0022482CC8|nr:hypothetical protein [Geovibrio ferrireducens]